MLEFNIKEILTATMVLFAIIDIIGNIPVVILIRKQSGHISSLKASIVSLVLMITFLFMGEKILSLIGITVSSFAVAGSFILFFISLEMILGIQIHKHESSKTASIVPLAFPIIVGPGSMTSLLSLKAEFATPNIIAAILINILLVYTGLKFSIQIEKFLGKDGISVIQRVFGIILLAIAVKLFASNVRDLIP